MLFLMALFIHTENQGLLWNIISNMEITKSVFVEGSPKKALWFKNIIEEFYIKNYGRNLTVSDLREVNRSVISYMVDNLKSFLHQSRIQTQSHQEPITVYSRNEQKTEAYSEQLGLRQKQYEDMVKKPSPPEVNFSDVIKDEPISNMEELLKEQQKQREYEIQALGQDQRPSISIHKQDDVTITPTVLDARKKVSWSDEAGLKQELDTIKEQLAQLFKITEQLLQHVPPETQDFSIKKS
jgi:nitrogen regulatory protein PII-like uncharacterized protein